MLFLPFVNRLLALSGSCHLLDGLDTVNCTVSSYILARHGTTDHLHGESGQELGVVDAATDHWWDPAQVR